MTKQKSIWTVKQATAQAFEKMPDEFLSINLVAHARAIMARPACMDGTILRRLRDLRDEKPAAYNYEVIDHDQSKYRKLKPTAQAV